MSRCAGQSRAAGRVDGPHRPEDRVVAVLPHDRRAPVAALARAEEPVLGVPVVPAARFLADVPTDRAHVADLRRGHRRGRRRQRRPGLPHLRGGGHLVQGGQGAQAQPAPSHATMPAIPGIGLQVGHERRGTSGGCDPAARPSRSVPPARATARPGLPLQKSGRLLERGGTGVSEGAQLHGYAFPRAARTFCGVSGISSRRTPIAW